MSATHHMMRQVTQLGWFLMMATSLSACAGALGIGSSTMSWKEEALLHDGRKIIVERFYKLGGHPTIDSRERAPLDQTVTFTHPDTGKPIVWTTDFRDSVPEPSSLNLILLDIVKGVPYLATYPAGCIAYNKWKRPNPPQILFKYEDDQWKRIAPAEFPADLRKANVIVGRPATSLLKSFYTVERVNEKNYDIHEAAYKTVLREAVAKAGGSCPELVYYKGAWVGPGDSIGKRMMDMGRGAK